LPGHQSAVVGADVPIADVVAHDDEDVGLLGLVPWLGLRRRPSKKIRLPIAPDWTICGVSAIKYIGVSLDCRFEQAGKG